MVFFKAEHDRLLFGAEAMVSSTAADLDDAQRFYRNHPTDANKECVEYFKQKLESRQNYLDELKQAKVISLLNI